MNAPAATRVAQITALAKDGYRAEQIGDAIGISVDHVRVLANRHGITLPNHLFGRRVRHPRVNHARVIEQTVLALEATSASLTTIGVSVADIDKAQAGDWARSIRASIHAFSQLRSKLLRRSHEKD